MQKWKRKKAKKKEKGNKKKFFFVSESYALFFNPNEHFV